MRDDIKAFVNFSEQNPNIRMKDLCMIFHYAAQNTITFNPFKLIITEELYKHKNVYSAVYRGRDLGLFYSVRAILQTIDSSEYIN
jgi:hypothetical protein